jgi:hypothetical protein
LRGLVLIVGKMPLPMQMEDNIDSGKTHKFFQWVAHEYAGKDRVKGRPRFVM